VLDALFLWRDRTARLEDQSVAYILPNHMILRIAELSPDNKESLFRSCKPNPTPCLKSNFEDVLRIIRDAKLDVQRVAQTPQKIITAPSSFIQTTSISHYSSISNDLDKNSDITQDQLFLQADWLAPSNSDLTKKRTAEFDFSNSDFKIASSPSSILFSSNVQTIDKLKIDKIMGNITAKTNLFVKSFELTPTSSPIERKNHSTKDVEVVPQSMEEIYLLSNQNRKRNKEKKKLKEDSLGDLTSTSSPTMIENENGGEQPKSDDAQDFMKKIGWISSEPQLHINTNINTKEISAYKQKKKQKIHSKDYSSVQGGNKKFNKKLRGNKKQCRF